MSREPSTKEPPTKATSKSSKEPLTASIHSGSKYQACSPKARTSTCHTTP